MGKQIIHSFRLIQQICLAIYQNLGCILNSKILQWTQMKNGLGVVSFLSEEIGNKTNKKNDT